MQPAKSRATPHFPNSKIKAILFPSLCTCLPWCLFFLFRVNYLASFSYKTPCSVLILRLFGDSLKGSSKPFGGVQLVLCGDFFQLPPVGLSEGTADFCFKARCWNEAVSESVILQQVIKLLLLQGQFSRASTPRTAAAVDFKAAVSPRITKGTIFVQPCELTVRVMGLVAQDHERRLFAIQ